MRHLPPRDPILQHGVNEQHRQAQRVARLSAENNDLSPLECANEFSGPFAGFADGPFLAGHRIPAVKRVEVLPPSHGWQYLDQHLPQSMAGAAGGIRVEGVSGI